MSRHSWTSPFQPKPYDGYILEPRNMDERGSWEPADITEKLNALGEKLQTSNDKLSSSWKLVGARPVIVILLRKDSIEVELGRTKNAKRDFSEWYLKDVVTCHWEQAEDRENPGPRGWTIKAIENSQNDIDSRRLVLDSVGICDVKCEPPDLEATESLVSIASSCRP